MLLAAVKSFQAGNIDEAETLLIVVLKSQPKNFDALHILGVIKGIKNRHREALDFFKKALKVDANNSYLNSNIAKAFSEIGDNESALKYNLNATNLSPNNPEGWVNYGKSLLSLKRVKDALEAIEKAINIRPDQADAWSNRGVALIDLKSYEEAVISFDNVIAIEPDHTDAYYNRGIALLELKRIQEAVASYDKSIAIEPDHADAWSNRGNALIDLKSYEEAVISLDKAIAIRPNHADAYYNRGIALLELKRIEEALGSYSKAIAIKPDHADAWSNRGNALIDLKFYEEAIISFDKAIAINPLLGEAWCNRGIALLELKRIQEALASYDKAIAIKPDHADAYWGKSLAFLVFGEFVQGWQLFEWRWKNDTFISLKRNFSQPLWLGTEDIACKTILLHAEQGLGDTIQFCRYAKLVKALGARVILEVPKALLGLLSGLEGVDELVEKGKALPAFDYHCPLLSLPLVFKTDLTNIPSPKPYLSAAPYKCEEWAQRLGVKGKPRVGLVWSGSTDHKNDHNRSLTLQQLLPHLPDSCEYVSMQKVVREVDVQVLEGSGISHYGQELKDFTDTAALCELMDLVISVDTSVAHLAGAIGKTTWVLLPYAPEWRWLLDRDDSPWYESVKLYRQDESREWSRVLNQAAVDLMKKQQHN